MFGRNHDQAGVLVELNAKLAIDPEHEEDLIKTRNILWFGSFWRQNEIFDLTVS